MRFLTITAILIITFALALIFSYEGTKYQVNDIPAARALIVEAAGLQPVSVQQGVMHQFYFTAKDSEGQFYSGVINGISGHLDIEQKTFKYKKQE